MKHRVGVVGLRQAAGLINIFESHPDTRVTAICDINEALLSEVGERHGIEQRFTDYEAFVQTDVDIVELSTPIQVHGQQAIAAMREGKHVLCQYIAAKDLAEASELLCVARASGKKYMFIETDCYEQKNRIMMELARRGVFGELTSGRGEYIHDCKRLGYNPDGSYTWRGEQWMQGLGAMAVGVHTCMPLLKMFGEWVETLCAIAQTYTRLGGYHGLVTELAIDYQTNLKPIYAILSDVLHGFAPQLPGPKSAEESRLLDRIATLDATNRLLQRENEQLHRCLR